MFSFQPPPATAQVSLTVNGRTLRVPAGISVAAALVSDGHRAIRRTPVTGTPRGPWCLMGACFDCLVTIDGVRDLQACMTSVRDGMRVTLEIPACEVRGDRDPDPWGPGP